MSISDIMAEREEARVEEGLESVEGEIWDEEP
jgi:hypothetical protein